MRYLGVGRLTKLEFSSPRFAKAVKLNYNRVALFPCRISILKALAEFLLNRGDPELSVITGPQWSSIYSRPGGTGQSY